MPVIERPAGVSRRTFWILASLTALFAWVASYRGLNDPDLHWHIETGEWIIEHRAVPRVDPFSFTFEGLPFRFVDWGGDVILAWLDAHFGAAGILTLAGLLATASVLAAAASMAPGRPPGTSTAPSAALAVAFLILIYDISAPRFTPRPQTIMFPLVGLEVLLFERAVSVGSLRPLWGLPPLLLFWSNFHVSSLIGVTLAAGFAAGCAFSLRGRRAETLRRRGREAALLAVAVLAAGFVAPNARGRVEAVVGIFFSTYTAPRIAEWQPTPAAALWGPLGLLALLTAAALALGRRTVAVWEVTLVAAVAWLGARHVRFLPLFALVAGPIAYRHLAAAIARLREVRGPSFRGAWFARSADRAVAGLLLLLVAASAWVFDHPVSWNGESGRPRALWAERAYPAGAADFIARERPRGRLYNTYHFGAYLMYRLWPDVKVFIDGRTANVYDDRHFREGVMEIKRTWPAVFRRWQIEYVVTQHDELGESLAADGGWSLVFLDDVALVFVRSVGQNRALAERLAYRDLLPPFSIHPGLPAEKLARLASEAERAVAEAPRSAVARSLRALVRVARGDDAGFEADMEEARRLHPDLLEPWLRLGLYHIGKGHYGIARDRLRRALAIAPREPTIRQALAIACLGQGQVADARAVLRPLATPGRDVDRLLREVSALPLGRLMHDRMRANR